MKENEVKKHTFSFLAENQPGALTRITALFSRRQFNIESLTVGPTLDPKIARVTIIYEGNKRRADQVKSQLDKLINVIKTVELKDDSSVTKEAMLTKVGRDIETDKELKEIIDEFSGQIIAETEKNYVIQTVGTREELERFIEKIHIFNIKEVVRSGIIAIDVSDNSI